MHFFCTSYATRLLVLLSKKVLLLYDVLRRTTARKNKILSKNYHLVRVGLFDDDKRRPRRGSPVDVMKHIGYHPYRETSNMQRYLLLSVPVRGGDAQEADETPIRNLALLP